MSENEIEKIGESIFESIKHVDEYGNEYWFARELMKVLEYKEWRKFEGVIKKAKKACENSANSGLDHFVGADKAVIPNRIRGGRVIVNIRNFLFRVFAGKEVLIALCKCRFEIRKSHHMTSVIEVAVVLGELHILIAEARLACVNSRNLGVCRIDAGEAVMLKELFHCLRVFYRCRVIYGVV